MLIFIKKHFRRFINVLLWINFILFTCSGFIAGFMFGFSIAGDNLIVRIAAGAFSSVIGQAIVGGCGFLINLFLGGIIVTFLELGNDISIIRAKIVGN